MTRFIVINSISAVVLLTALVSTVYAVVKVIRHERDYRYRHRAFYKRRK